MVLDKESWTKMPADTPQVSLAGLTGDGAALIIHSTPSMLGQGYRRDFHSSSDAARHKSSFANWLRIENPFSARLEHGSRESSPRFDFNGSIVELWQGDKASFSSSPKSLENGSGSVLEDENEDLLADFIDEDSQLPSRISNSRMRRGGSAQRIDEEISAQTGSSLCLLRYFFLLYFLWGLFYFKSQPLCCFCKNILCFSYMQKYPFLGSYFEVV
jgi:syndetin